MTNSLSTTMSDGHAGYFELVGEIGKSLCSQFQLKRAAVSL